MFVKAKNDWTGEEKYINLNFCRVLCPSSYGFEAVIDDGYDESTFYRIEGQEAENIKSFLGIPVEKKSTEDFLLTDNLFED